MLLLGDRMNSKELNVNVPLATVESDSEEFEVRQRTVANKPWLRKNILI